MDRSNPILISHPVLPDNVVTIFGFEFDPRPDMWRIPSPGGRLPLNFSELYRYFTPDLVLSTKCALAHIISVQSVGHAYSILSRLGAFARFIVPNPGDTMAVDRIRAVDILNYRAALNPQNEWYLSVLRIFFTKWHELGYPGIDNDVLALFKDLRLKRNRKGAAVRMMDPCDGPFTDIELQSLHDKLNDAFAVGEITVRQFVLGWLYFSFGARSVQIAALKIKDFSLQRASDGTWSYLLSIPRAKQHGKLIREEFKVRPLIPEIGEVLRAWTEYVKDHYKAHINDGIGLDELPIFPKWRAFNAPGFDHHATGNELAIEIKTTFKNLPVTSERTGLQIKTNARRFRYTIGTRAAAEGRGELVIAEILDHSDTQSVGVYVESTPRIVDRIDKAVALQLAPLAQAFSGIVVLDQSEATRGDEPASHIRLDGGIESGVGTCGKFGFCGGLAPIACYTCRNFQAWLDGPHERVLDFLLSERARLIREIGDHRIASANDRTIYAVAEVVRQCNEIKRPKDAEK